LSFCLSTLDFATEFLGQKIYSLEFNFSGAIPFFMDLVKRLVFIGGGHSHAISLCLWGQSPPKNVQLTLISDVTHSSPIWECYPATLPVFNDFAETHIHLLFSS
jgi:hypothetical protein